MSRGSFGPLTECLFEMYIRYGGRVVLDDVTLVADKLEARPNESLAAAAARLLQQNCAPRVSLDIARVVIQAKDCRRPEQWHAIAHAAKRLRTSN